MWLKQNLTSNNFCCSVSSTFMVLCLWRAHRWTHWLHSKDLYSIDTPSSIIVRKVPFYIHIFFTEIVKFHLAVLPRFIVGYLWSSAQGVATSCSLSTFQMLSDDKRLPSLALTINLHVISCVSFPRCNTFFCGVVLHAFFQLTNYKNIIEAETFHHTGSKEWKLRTPYPGLNIANNKPTLTLQITSQCVMCLAAVRDVQ